MVTITERLIKQMAGTVRDNNHIKLEHYQKHKVKRGLRNKNGTGVLVGLTQVGSVRGYTYEDGMKMSCPGNLFYRGISIHELVKGFQDDRRFGFEETVFLLLFGYLPSAEELVEFNSVLGENRALPDGFTENMILKIPSKNIMNKIQRSILVLYSHDDDPDSTELENLMKQSIKLIGMMPTIISYGYQAKSHYFDKNSLYIHKPQKDLSTSENILHMIRCDNQYTKLEAETLDLLLVLHAEHGGGNNSAFTTSVISSTGTDTYSAMAAAVGSLKGPKHGGANIMVTDMIKDIKRNCDYTDKASLKRYLKRILNKEVFNKTGLIYGMGHAVYTISDPRAELIKEKTYELAVEKGRLKDYQLYEDIEGLTKVIFKEIRGETFEIAANVDLYSGLIYQMLNIPEDIYTPLFAVARIAGWCAHRMEQILSDPRILRPAYAYVDCGNTYTELKHRGIPSQELGTITKEIK